MISASRRLFLIAFLAACLATGLFGCDDESDSGGSVVTCGEGAGSEVLITVSPNPCTATTPIRTTQLCLVCSWQMQNDSGVTLTTTGLSNEPDTIVQPDDGVANPGVTASMRVDVDCSTAGTMETGTFEVTVRNGTGDYVCSTGFPYDVTVGSP